MPVHKLREAGNSVVITLPKDELKLDGYVDEEGNVREAQMIVQRDNSGRFTVADADKFGGE